MANSVTLGDATVTTTTLTFAASDSTLAVGGDVVLTAPSGAATRDLQVNAGAMTVDGNLRKPSQVYRKVMPRKDAEAEAEMEGLGE